MEGEEESIFDTIFDEEDGGDVQMLDVEEGELLIDDNKNPNQRTADLGGESDFGGDVDLTVAPLSQESENQNQNEKLRNGKRNKKKKSKKNKGKKSGYGSNVTDINRFVVETCKRLCERKSYLVWTAVGCLGVYALSDLVREVDAIQSCGGQKTSDGKRFKTGGGILWSILRARDPNAFKEIMKKGKEFEKQFKQPVIRQAAGQNKQSPPANVHPLSDQVDENLSRDSEFVPHVQDQIQQSSSNEQKRRPVHDRIRVPVTYNDLVVGAEGPEKESC